MCRRANTRCVISHASASLALRRRLPRASRRCIIQIASGRRRVCNSPVCRSSCKLLAGGMAMLSRFFQRMRHATSGLEAMGGVLQRVLFLPGIAAVVALPLVIHFAIRLVPIPAGLLEPPLESMQFSDRHGQPLRELLVDSRHFTRMASLDGVPQALIDATVASEDKRFWRHSGVNVPATARAFVGLMKNRRVVSGASTITQQLVKIADAPAVPRPRTIRTKLTEIAGALRLEQSWSKRQILEAYLNRLDYGNLRIGCASAAAYYFGKPLADLSTAEAAFLAGLPQAPTRLNPHLHFDRAKKRQAWVLAQ